MLLWKLLFIFVEIIKNLVNGFEIKFLEDVDEFFEQIPSKAKEKILYNINKAKLLNDPELFKKLNDRIWEFRTTHLRQKYRLLAFWDNNANAFIVCTHGFVKKTGKVPQKEIEKAEDIRNHYLKI